MEEEAEVAVGSDNVFADVGVVDPEEALRKAKLARSISEIIIARKLDREKVSRLFGLSQPEVFMLERGQLRDISFERLLQIFEIAQRFLIWGM